MPRTYGVEFRKKVLETVLGQEGSQDEIARRFKISVSTVKRIIKRYRETGEVRLYLDRVGRRALIDAAGETTLRDFIAEKPDATLREIQGHYRARHGIEPVLAVFHRVLKGLKLSYKKKSLFAQQQLRADIKKKERTLWIG